MSRSQIASFLILMLCAHGASGQVVVNEVMPANSGSLLDEDGDSSDWIELFNSGSSAVAMEGFGLSDDPNEPFRWTLPSFEIAPGAFAVVFASGKDRRGREGAWSTVVDRGHIWRYAVGSGAISPDWSQPAYNDAGWPEGPSGIGYGDEDDNTVLSGNILSAFARARFQVDDPDQISGVDFSIDYDDSFVAYLNGVEIARANIGTPGAPVGADVPAITQSEARLYQGLSLEAIRVDPGLLVAGENVLAVQVHNNQRQSSDMTMIPFLSLGVGGGSLDTSGMSAEVPFPDRPLHASFRVADDETICLTSPDGLFTDCLPLEAAPDNVSVGRTPDGTVGLFADPTPGSENGVNVAMGTAPEVWVSLESGIYPQARSIVLSSQGVGRVVFTLDGSEPTDQSDTYTTAIRISDSAVLRARVLQSGMLPGPVETRTYYINADPNLPVVSITTDPDLLFHPQTGLYVRGPGAESSFPYFGANFWEDREIPVYLEWLEADRPAALNQWAGLKIYGGWSRGHDQKSFALYARGRYGASDFAYRFFDSRAYSSYQTFILRNSGNDWNRSMLRDAYMQELVADTEIDRLAYRPSVVLINGAYWGLQNVREKINEHYVQAISGVDSDMIDLVEFGQDSGVGPIQGTIDAWDALIERVSRTDIGTAAAFRDAGMMLDLDNFADYQIAQIYFDNQDWPGNNSKAWRPRTDDGRFRFILYDTDFGWGIWNPSAWQNNTLAFATEANGPAWPNPPWSTFLLRRLLLNPQFRAAFMTRYADFLNTRFRPDAAVELLDQMADAIRDEIPRHGARWGLSQNAWNQDIANMRTFARSRPSMALNHVRSYFGASTLSLVSVEVAGARGGKVQVNRELHAEPWSGAYFDGLPLPVTAVPSRGYRFSHWSGGNSTSQRSILVDPAGGLSLTAHFEVDTGDPSAVVINEINYNPAGAASEWIELINVGTTPVNLSGWQLSDASGDSLVIGAVTMDPGGYAVFCGESEVFRAEYGYDCTGVLPFRLSNSGDVLRLLDSGGVVADSVSYLDGPPWPSEPDGSGRSLELLNPDSDNALAAAWRPSTWMGGSPGWRNSTATDAEGQLPVGDFALSMFPNPAGAESRLLVTMPRTGQVVVEVFDLLGRRVQDKQAGQLEAGRHEIAGLLKDIASGVYMVRVKIDGLDVGSLPVIRVR